MDDNRPDNDERDHRPQAFPGGEVAVLQRVGDVEEGTDAADAEKGDDRTLSRPGLARGQRDPSRQRADHEQEGEGDGDLAPADVGEQTPGHRASQENDDGYGEHPLDLLDERVKHPVIAVLSLRHPDGACADEDGNESVPLRELSHPVGDEGGGQGDEALRLLGQLQLLRHSGEEQLAESPPDGQPDEQPDRNPPQDVHQCPVKQPPARGDTGQADRNGSVGEGKGEPVVEARL